MAKQAIPEQAIRHFANQSMNFLEGFYKPGITEWGKGSLYAQEGIKAAGRVIKMAANPYESIAYDKTGVSSLIKQKIGSMEAELKVIDDKYLAGDYGEQIKFNRDGSIKKGGSVIKKAKQAKNRIIKERHYKILNDAANREIFGGKISNVLTDYRKRKPHLQNFWDYDKVGNQFRKLTGNDDIAEYIVSRHKIGLPGFKRNLSMGTFDKVTGKLIKSNPNMRYIKWFDSSVSGVLRGAQFNYPTYEALNELKTGRMGQTQAINYLQKKGFNPTKIGKKILFNFNPSIKSNFDWGGYNAVAEWDYSRKGKVILHATDLRDTPISSFFKGKNVLNYVKSKEISIKTIKNNTDMETKPNKITPEEYAKKTKSRKLDPVKSMNRQQVLKSGMLEPGGQIKTIRKDIHTVGSKAQKSYENVHLRNLFKKSTKASKSLLKYGKYLGKATSAAGLLSLAAILYASKD